MFHKGTSGDYFSLRASRCCNYIILSFNTNVAKDNLSTDGERELCSSKTSFTKTGSGWPCPCGVCTAPMQNSWEKPIPALGSVLAHCSAYVLVQPLTLFLSLVLDLLAPILSPLLAILNYGQSLFSWNIRLPPERNSALPK